MQQFSDIFSGGFDPSKVEDTAYEPLPDGIYTVVVNSAEVKPTKANDGYYMQVEFSVVSGPREGSTVTERYTLANKSEKSTQIGHGQLKRLAEAAIPGVVMRSENDLIDKVLLITTKQTKKDGYTNINVTKYARAGAVQATSAPVSTPMQNVSAMPWE